MAPSPRPPAPIAGLVGLLSASALVWGTLRFGAAQTRVLYLFFIGLGVAAAVALVARRTRWTRGDAALLAAGILLLLPVAVVDTTRARGWVVVSCGWLALFLARWLAGSHRAGVRLTFSLLILLGGLEAAYGFVQSIGGVDYIGSYFRGQGLIATGSFVHHGSYAGMLNMALALALGLLVARAAARQRRPAAAESAARLWLQALGCAAIGLAVLLSQSRGGVLSLLGVLLFLAFLVTLDRRGRRRRALVAVWVVPAAMLALGLSLGLDALMARFEMMPQDNRPEYYRAALRVIAAYPLTGVGPGMFRWFVQPYQTIQVDRQLVHAHNDYLQTAAEWGVPLAAALWCVLLHRLYRTCRLYLEARDRELRGRALGCACALLALVLHAAVDFNFYIPVNLAMFCAIAGVATHLDRRSPPREIRPPWLVFVRAVTVAALVVALWQTVPRLRAEWAYRDPGPDGGARAAARLDPERGEYHYRVGLEARDDPDSFDLPGAVAAFERAVALVPWHWRYRQELARAYELQGRTADAERELRAAVDIKPTRPWNRWQLGSFLIRRQRADEALEVLRPAFAGAPELLVPGYAGLREAGVPPSRIAAVWPASSPARLRLMRLLGADSREPAVVSLLEDEWDRLLSASPAPAVGEALFYFRWLLDGGLTERARQAWIELARRHGIEDGAFEDRRNLIWNGGFERELTGVLDWRAIDADGVEILREPGEGRGGGAALAVRFDRESGADFASRPVFVVVRPGPHRLRFATRSRDLRGGGGVLIQVRSAPGGVVLAESAPVAGNTPWREHELFFDVPADSGLIQLRLRVRRRPGLDRGLQGRYWLDEVRLQREAPP